MEPKGGLSAGLAAAVTVGSVHTKYEFNELLMGRQYTIFAIWTVNRCLKACYSAKRVTINTE